MENYLDNFPVLEENLITCGDIHQKPCQWSRMKVNPERCLHGPRLVGMADFWTEFPQWLLLT